MAIFHFTVKIVGRSKGKSVISASAYLNGDVMKNEETGRISYYTSKKEVVYTSLMMCENAPPEWLHVPEENIKRFQQSIRYKRADDKEAALERLDDFRKIGVPIQCDVDDARLLQGFHNRKAKIIKGDICEERGHRRLMRDEGETKLTPQEQSLNEEIEKLQDQWPYLMNEIFFIDYLKNPTYERGLAAKSKILVCFNDELLAAFLSAYKKANISEQQEMLTILKEISFRGGAVERDETDTEVTRKNLEKLENALNSEVEHTSDAVKKFYANRHLETVKQIRQKFLNTREM